MGLYTAGGEPALQNIQVIYIKLTCPSEVECTKLVRVPIILHKITNEPVFFIWRLPLMILLQGKDITWAATAAKITGQVVLLDL